MSHTAPNSIGKYTISKVLGQGAMGTVYKGFDTQIERSVAIKTLHPHLINAEGGEDLLRRFKQEAQAAARCLHPNIVTIFEYGVTDDASFIVMEYVEGQELREYIHNRRINSAVQAVKITLQVLDGLQAAHDQGVIHRDIKPANIIILHNGRVKVSDFGVARLDTSDLTSAGFMVGTPNYMSPEGLRGQTVDHRSDLYSCALLLLEMITYIKPYAGTNTQDLLKALTYQTQFDPSLRDGLADTLTKAAHKDPAQRHQSADEFSQTLNELISRRHEDEDDQKTVISPAAMNAMHSSLAQPIDAGTLNPDILKVIENSLVEYIGPMARVLIEKSSKTTSGVAELSQVLADMIPADKERRQFLQQLNKSGIYEHSASRIQQAMASDIMPANLTQHTHSGQGHTAINSPTLTPEVLQKVIDRLVVHTGPLAARIVQHSAKRMQTLPALIEEVSQHIPNDAERRAFKKHFN